ncbi:MAG: hypothetical protein IK038_03670 [Bacteroidaceae bacterium]|nr:hypothetical protein [Bacteroidaceae bacterium]
MNKESCLRLEEIATALSKADEARMSPELSSQDREIMEQACVTLREAERAAIVNTETGLIEQFTRSAGNVKLQTKEIRALVTKMNRIPRSLDITETVIKECVRVLKAIAMWCTMLFMLLYLSGCSSMTKAQMKRVNSLAVVSDSSITGPGSIMRTLNEVYLDRGLIYAASLQGADNRIRELNGLADATSEFSRLADKSDVCINILNSYVRALRSVSSETRWKQNGTELRGIGRNMDSLAIAYNKLDWGTLYEPGIAKQIGKTSGYLAEQYGKRHQRKTVEAVLAQGDKLVDECVQSLVAVLKSDDFKTIIENERTGLENNYRVYLNAAVLNGVTPDSGFDRLYIENRLKIEQAESTRRQCITMLQSFRRAHAALLKEMETHRTYAEFADALFELNKQITSLR